MFHDQKTTLFIVFGTALLCFIALYYHERGHRRAVYYRELMTECKADGLKEYQCFAMLRGYR